MQIRRVKNLAWCFDKQLAHLLLRAGTTKTVPAAHYITAKTLRRRVPPVSMGLQRVIALRGQSTQPSRQHSTKLFGKGVKTHRG